MRLERLQLNKATVTKALGKSAFMGPPMILCYDNIFVIT